MHPLDKFKHIFVKAYRIICRSYYGFKTFTVTCIRSADTKSLNFSVTGRKRNKHSAAYFNFAFKFFRDKIIKRFINLL